MRPVTAAKTSGGMSIFASANRMFRASLVHLASPQPMVIYTFSRNSRVSLSPLVQMGPKAPILLWLTRLCACCGAGGL